MEVNPPELFWIKDQFDVIDDGRNIFQRCTLEIREDIFTIKPSKQAIQRGMNVTATLLASNEIHRSKMMVNNQEQMEK